MTAKPWREVAVPRQDVREGRFLQSEFAADLAAVREGRAPEEYQDAPRVFERTFITEGMGNLLVQVARRLLGQDAEPVVQLQTAFGGGTTHTLLAVYHLATRRVPLGDLPGVASLLDREGLEELPAARAAVLDGNAGDDHRRVTIGSADSAARRSGRTGALSRGASSAHSRCG